jgi:hypothetical protein
VAVETTGHWYRLLDAIEKAGLEPHLAHALAAKRMMVGPNKTDSLDAKRLATLFVKRELAGSVGPKRVAARPPRASAQPAGTAADGHGVEEPDQLGSGALWAAPTIQRGFVWKRTSGYEVPGGVDRGLARAFPVRY